MALSLRKQFDEAEKEFEIAIRLDPKLFEAYYFYARARFAQGRLEDAAHWFEEASRVRPEDYQSPSLLSMVYSGLGRKADAQASYRRALEGIEKHLELHPDDARATYFGAGSLAQLGQRERALEWARRALAMDPDDSGVLYNVACIYSLLGQTEQALDCLEKAVAHGFGHKSWLENDSDLNAARSHPRFQALFARL